MSITGRQRQPVLDGPRQPQTTPGGLVRVTVYLRADEWAGLIAHCNSSGQKHTGFIRQLLRRALGLPPPVK